MIMSETQEQQIRELRDKNIKWNGENGMKKLMVVGEKCHATWRVVLLQDECVDCHLRASKITQDKTSNLRGHKPY